MLKRKIARIAAIAGCLAATFFTSCSSSPDIEKVEPLSLLTEGSSLYVYVPVQHHKKFVATALEEIMEADRSDAEKIAAKINDLYIGTKQGEEFEISASGNFPYNVLKYALTEKKGWIAQKYKYFSYYTQNLSKIQLSVPCQENAVISYGVEKMLDRYDSIQSKKSNSSLDENIVSYLNSGKDDEILFISTEPELFFQSFFGTSIAFGVNEIRGMFTNIPNASDKYGVTLVLEMADSRTIKAAIRILQVALFGTPAKIEQSGSSQISITDLTLTWTEILTLISK